MFTVLLPASHAVRRVETPTPSLPETTLIGGTILIVDDEPALRAVAQRTLEQREYHVLVAENGQQGIALLVAQPEVRAVMLAMPVMGGDTAGPMIRSLRPDVPVILSSGYSEWGALERVAQDVAVAFLEKPYRADVLVAKVEQVLRSRPSN